MRRTPGLIAALRHRDFRLLLTGYTAAVTGGWAYNVGLAVWIYDETHSAGWLAAATACRFVPALLFSTYAGVLADRFERVRLMVILDVAAAAFMGLLAIETALGLPVIAVVMTAALSATVGTVYEPAAAALTPQVVGERDLAAANALRNTIDNIAVIAGPGIGVLALAVGSPPVAIALNALTFSLSAAAISRIGVRSRPADVTEGGTAGPIRQMLVGVKAMGSSATAVVLVGYSLVATVVYGFDTVQFVVLSRDLLGTGADGYGYLLAGLGIGGVLAAPVVVRLERAPRLSIVIVLGLAAYCLPTLLYLVVTDTVVATLIQVVRGAGTLVVDVLAITALQRALPSDILARVFGAFNALFLGAVVLGAALSPLVIGSFGLRASIWFAGGIIPLLSLLGWPLLSRMDREIAARRERLEATVRILEGCDLFDALSEGALEQLAAAVERVDAPAGQAVVVEGQQADAFYVITAGRVEVTSIGERRAAQTLGELGNGEYFGEIGLIEAIPRTATVTALVPTTLLRIAAPEWLDAMASQAPSPALLEAAATRLGRTHPSYRLERGGIGAGAVPDGM